MQLPHHSPQSWETHIARNHPNLIESVRKTVGIAQRKVARNGSGAQIASTPPNNHDSHAKAQEQDFDTICDFFAKGIDGSGSSDESDEAVWAALDLYVSPIFHCSQGGDPHNLQSNLARVPHPGQSSIPADRNRSRQKSIKDLQLIRMGRKCRDHPSSIILII